MAKITICTNESEVFEIIENISYEDLINRFRKSVLSSQIEDGLKRAINAENKVNPDQITTMTLRDRP